MSEEKPRVLVVDDEPNILNALRRLLHRGGFDAVFTASPAEALKHADEGDFDVIISDYRMPEMSGSELMERMCEIRPEAVRMILTGYADVQAAIEAINRGAVYRFLTKPWDDDELIAHIREAVERSRTLKKGECLPDAAGVRGDSSQPEA
jgi:DNA-binding NtrC family response regulator